MWIILYNCGISSCKINRCIMYKTTDILSRLLRKMTNINKNVRKFHISADFPNWKTNWQLLFSVTRAKLFKSNRVNQVYISLVVFNILSIRTKLKFFYFGRIFWQICLKVTYTANWMKGLKYSSIQMRCSRSEKVCTH